MNQSDAPQSTADQAPEPAGAGVHPPDSLEHVACPLCGADPYEHVITGREMQQQFEEPFDIVRCAQCGVRYTNPRPRAEFLDRYYPATYYREGGDRTATKPQAKRERGWRERWTRLTLRHHFGYPGPRHPLIKMLTWPMALRIRYGRKYFNAIAWSGQGRLLDFGFGDGKFLRLQRDRGWTVSGVDFNPTIVRWAREEDGIDAEVGVWPGDAMAGRTFDTITAWHVLEHLPDPPGWLRCAVERLEPGGRLIICCPDSDSWGCEKFGIYWFGLELPRHFLHYTKYDLKRLLEEAGLTVTRIRPQVRPTVLKRSAEYRARYTGSGLWKWLSRQGWIWRLVGMFSGWFGKADCVILYARKPG